MMALRLQFGKVTQAVCPRVANYLHMCNEYRICAFD